MEEQIKALLNEALESDAIVLCKMYSMSIDDAKIAALVKDGIIEKHRNYLSLMNSYKCKDAKKGE